MIICITPNAAVDRTVIVPGFQKGQVCRAVDTIIAAGGKGHNVARAARTLGSDPLCAGFVGGYSGRLLVELAGQEGLKGIWTWIEQETRTCTIIIDSEAAQEQATVINEAGPSTTAGDWARLQADILREINRAEAVCLCGSLPAGSPVEAPANLVAAVNQTGRPIWVDTSGLALDAVLTAAPGGLKINASEAGTLLGEEVYDVAGALRAAARIRAMNVKTVVLTLGEEGAVLVNEVGSWWARPPVVKAISAVGSGDAFLAGLLAAEAAGHPPAEALRLAVAAGAANTLQPGGGRLALTDVQAILARSTVTSLAP